MIGKLRGLVDAVEESTVLIDVGGVFYLCHCSAATLASLPRKGEPAELHVETVVREDSIRLYGFSTLVEKQWFNLLMTVQGVGTRVALNVLSTLGPNDLATAIALEDKAAVGEAPGVGPKVAQRIVSELKGKSPLGAVPQAGIAGLAEAMNGARGPAADAVSALVHLGYSQIQAAGAVARAVAKEGEGAATERLIKTGLKELSQ